MEIEAARKRKEAEARRKAEAERKQKEAQKETLAENKKAEAPESKVEVYKTDNEDRRLSDVFEKNKGKLPMPITGAYAIVGHYGKYQVKGLRNVRLDNKGIDIKGKEGAQAASFSTEKFPPFSNTTAWQTSWCATEATFRYIAT